MKQSLILGFTLLSLIGHEAYAQSSTYKRPGEDVDLCPEKSAIVKAEGKLVVGCSCTNFGKAISADYQPLISHSNTSKVSQVVSRATKGLDYSASLHKYYGVENMKNFSGLPSEGGLDADLMSKFETFLAKPEGDASALSYIKNDYVPRTQYKPGVSAATGSCEIWSAWSMDREVRQLMDSVKGGILCSGVPFTKAELKELITAVYPEPSPFMTYKNPLKGYYDPNNIGVWDPNSGRMVTTPTRSDREVEDANLALAKLGDFGAGSGFSPEALVSGAKSLKDAGSIMIMDLDPGIMSLWNQPIEAVTDVSFKANGQERVSLLKSSDLSSSTQPNPSGPAQVPSDPLINQLRRVEDQLSYQALRGIIKVSPELESLRSMAGATIRMNPNASMMEQVAELKRIQLESVSSGKLLARTSPDAVVKHRLFMQYGQETDFGVNEENPSLTRELDYVTVNGRSNFSPPTMKLSQACQGDLGAVNGGKRVNNTGADNTGQVGLVATNSTLARDCYNINSQGDREIAAGAFPPKAINVYTVPTGDARFAYTGSDGKRRAFNKVKEMIQGCNANKRGSFDEASQFIASLKGALSTGDVTPYIPQLKAAYAATADFLDDPAASKEQNFVKEIIAGAQAQNVAGVNALYSSLFP